MTPEAVAALFTGPQGFRCARWGRPVAPVVFGTDDATLGLLRPALAAALAHAGVPLAEADPESGANLVVFLCPEWSELAAVPGLDGLTGVTGLPDRLADEGADHWRAIRFDAAGAIRAVILLCRLTGAEHPAALGEWLAVNALLTFAAPHTPSPALAALIRAAYDPRLPVCATDPAHALRLAARLAAS